MHHRFVQYKSTSLEKSYKYELLAEHDLGITIDLIDPEAYAKKPDAQKGLDPADEKLLEEDAAPLGPKDQLRYQSLKENKNKTSDSTFDNFPQICPARQEIVVDETYRIHLDGGNTLPAHDDARQSGS